MQWTLQAECKLPPRERELIRQELKETLDVASMTETRKTFIWELIDELEEGAWQGGASEGYDHGYQDADHKHTGD